MTLHERLTHAVNTVWMRLIWVAAGGVLLGAVVSIFGYRCASYDYDSILVVPSLLLYCIGIYLATKGRFRSIHPVSLCAVILMTGLALLVRYALFDLPSSDYAILTSWMSAFQAAPGLKGLGVSIGDYNVPYLYLLFVLAKIMPQPTWLYGIKLLSMLFELILALVVAKLVALKSSRYAVQCAAFFTVLFAPSILSNGAIFVQCDAIYTAFAVAGLYYGIQRRSKLCFLMMALSFSFKLQGVFFLPMLLVLLFAGRIRLRDVWVFPATFSALLIPAIAAGRDALETFTIYFHQARFYPQLTLQAPTAYSIFYSSEYSLYHSQFTNNRIFSFAGILFTGVACLVLLLYLYRIRHRLGQTEILDSAFLFALIIPLFLPHMHERYFFCADVLSILYLYSHRERWYIPFTVILISFLCCYTEAPATEYPVSLGVMGIVMLTLTAFTLYRFYTDTANKPNAIGAK